MTYNLNLRAVEPSDLDFLYMLESAEGCADASLNSAPVSRQLLWEYIQSYTADIFADGLTQLCDYASTTLGMHQLAAVVAVDNAPSIALFKSCGFKSTGRLRSWIRRGRTYADALIFQRLF